MNQSEHEQEQQQARPYTWEELDEECPPPQPSDEEIAKGNEQ